MFLPIASTFAIFYFFFSKYPKIPFLRICMLQMKYAALSRMFVEMNSFLTQKMY